MRFKTGIHKISNPLEILNANWVLISQFQWINSVVFPTCKSNTTTFCLRCWNWLGNFTRGSLLTLRWNLLASVERLALPWHRSHEMFSCWHYSESTKMPSFIRWKPRTSISTTISTLALSGPRLPLYLFINCPATVERSFRQFYCGDLNVIESLFLLRLRFM